MSPVLYDGPRMVTTTGHKHRYFGDSICKI